MENENIGEQGRVEGDAHAVEEDFGECAPVYAEVRAKAAEIRGDTDAAGHWQMVRHNLEADDGDERE